MIKAEYKKNQPRPAQRGGASIFYHEKKVYVFGGGSQQGAYNDIWALSYDKSSHKPIWEQVNHKGAISYTPRTGQAATKCGDYLFVYGGQEYMKESYGDAYLYKISTNEWETIIGKGSKKEPNQPSNRNSCTVNYDSKKNRIVMYGGADENGPLGDVYFFDIEKRAWEKPQIKGSFTPVAREMHTAIIYHGVLDFPDVKIENKTEQKKEKTIDLNFGTGIVTQTPETEEETQPEKTTTTTNSQEETKIDEKSEPEKPKDEKKPSSYLIVFGGRYVDEMSSEVLALDLETLEWKFLCNMPVKLCTHATEIAGDRVFIYGGTDGAQLLDTLYSFDLKTKKWYIYVEKKINNEQIRLPRIASSLCYHEENDELIVYGGLSYMGIDADDDLYFLPLGDSFSKNFHKLKI